MIWKNDISKESQDWMKLLGSFSPTVRESDKTIKGYMLDDEGDGGKVYMDSDALRGLAKACNEVAEWLDKRAAEEDRC